MAEYVRIPERTFKRVLQSLIDAGLVVCKDSDQVYNGGRVLEYRISTDPSAKMAQTPVPPRHKGSATMAQGVVPQWHKGSANVAQGTPYIITSNKQIIDTNNIQGEKAPSKNSREIILSGVVSFYEKNGRVYIPDFRIETTAASELAAKIEMAMKADGWALDGESMAAWWAQFLQAGYATADAWMREHYDIKNINSQFNSLYQNVKNGKATPKKGERLVTDDHIAELIRQANGAI